MSARNHEFTFRPLIGGIAIINPSNERPGTLGAILADGPRRFALSCYHVLCRPNGGPFTDGEAVWQSLPGKEGAAFGTIAIANASVQLDCAAALITQGVSVSGRLLGLSPLGAPVVPAVGMRVLKSGYATGITEGEIIRVQGDQVEIQRPAGFHRLYELSDFGDSGAVWVERSSGSAVAMHTGVSAGNATAVSMTAVLAALGMTLVGDP